jgi:hypothetical protein
MNSTVTGIQHYHIEKCGGTTLQHFFLNACPRDHSLWMDRVTDVPPSLGDYFRRISGGCPEEADRVLSRALLASVNPLRGRLRAAMFSAFFDAWPGPLRYVHNPYREKCVTRSRRLIPLIIVRNPFQRFISHLKHIERYTDEDLKHARPLDLAIHRQVLQLSFEELAFGKQSIVPITQFSSVYSRVVRAVAQLPFASTSGCRMSRAITRMCVPLERVSDLLAALCSHLKVSNDFAAIHSNAAQPVSRFDCLEETSLDHRCLRGVRNMSDYRLWEVALNHTSGISEWMGRLEPAHRP